MLEDIVVEGVYYGDGMAEIIGLTIKTSGREWRNIVVTYVPQTEQIVPRGRKNMR